MDPNEALRLARESANEVISARADDREDDDPRPNDLELAEQFLALDEWLTKGGFPPADWDHRPTA